MGVEKHARDLQIVTLAMQGVPVGEIANRLGLHRNTVCKRLQRPETRQLLDTLQKELIHHLTAQTAERLEAARQAAKEERARKRALRQGQGTSLPSGHTPFDAFDPYAPIRQYLARQR